jgi:allantoinase
LLGILDIDSTMPGLPVNDFGNLVVMPGLVDTHVHVNEPGRTEWEGFDTATRAAAAGGITMIVDMPLNSTPVTTSPGAFREKLDNAEGKLWVDCGFYGGVIPENCESIQSIIDAGVLGLKAFLIHSGIDDFPNVEEAHLRHAMPVIARSGLPLLVHCELDGRSTENSARLKPGNPSSYREYLDSRPREWEHRAIDLMTGLCAEFGCRVHIVHVSSADAIPGLRIARRNGLQVTTETCPHYLYFCAEEIRDGDTRLKCAPPIREKENRERLWNALEEGDIDFIVSDHSPSLPELKRLESGDFQKAWGGISSLQFGLPVVWTEARKHGRSVLDIADWMSRRPAEFVGMGGRKGAIAADYDADFVVWNPDESFTVAPETTYHRHRMTPYEGKTMFGRVHATYLRGEKIFEEGVFQGRPTGQVICRNS